MVWIKLTYATGSVFLNLEQVYSIQETSATEITIYDSNSILPISYAFASAQEKDDTVAKLEKIIRSIDIDQLANQG